MSGERLLDRAHAFEDWIEKAFIDSNGIVYTYLDVRTNAALTDDSYDPGQVPMHLPGTESYTPAQWHNYENCGMTTGAYLQALLYRYAIDRDPAALARARRCFAAIGHVYDIGRQLEEGFFPKIYGNRFSEQTSTDQVLYAVLALDHFHPYAAPAEQTQISRMIGRMIRFWVNREYRYQYFWIADMLWPLGRFTSLLLLAHKHSGDPLFKNEYDRLLAMGVNAAPVEARLAPKLAGKVEPLPYEKEQQAWLIGEMEGAVSMDIMELDCLLRHDPHNRWAAKWKDSIRKAWDEATLVLAPDGTQYVHVLVDMVSGKPRRPEPGFFRESSGPSDWIGFRYVAGSRSADSTLLARSAVQAEPHLHDPDMRRAARLIIRSLDPRTMRSYYDPDRYPPELRHRTELYSGDGATNWLWAYWLGRQYDIFTQTDVCNGAPR